ncbi:hypothetical protein PQR46_34450 [Paraburkholderia sediminicola]|uniref:hypothetical protein n=1 Tax=Paraburkholderia TaxID=1822464 RepID=UPI0038BC6BBA
MDLPEARESFRAYVRYLQERIAKGTLSSGSATAHQNDALRVMAALSGVDTMHHGIDLCRIDTGERRFTDPPPDEDVGKVLALCRALFDGLSSLCLESRPYPFALAVPKHLACPGNMLWIFPSFRWYQSPQMLSVRGTGRLSFWAFDYENGKISTAEEIRKHYKAGGDAARKAVASANTAINNANKCLTAQNVFRRNAGFIAHNAFILLFLANTGMNWGSLVNLPCSDECEISAERQGLRSVKYRAGGKIVSFEIQTIFMPFFRTFLKLRAFLLDGHQFDHLFIGRPRSNSKSNSLEVKPLSAYSIQYVYGILRNVDPNLPIIKARKFRAAKSDWLLRNHDPATTARVLQNSVPTVLRFYAEGSPRTQEDEFARFFDGLRATVIAANEAVRDEVEIPAGGCSAHGLPQKVGNAPVESNCRDPLGCLFCDKYKVHTDERDVRKLLSCRYCIERTSHLADSEEQFQLFFEPILTRIKYLLDEVDRRCVGLVGRIMDEVAAGELDPYWSSKLEMLIHLELVL